MIALRLIRFLATHIALQLLAVGCAIAYVLHGNALPEFGGRLLAGAVLAWLVGAVIWRFVQVVKNAAGSVPGNFDRRS